ncbi:MAG: MBL fold metallo-hydrolase [Thermodesulfobacteriota bacterium]|nr:MBL fold metallo-hydrolase [Thermodesulfobacteriota bacterium]
MEVIILGSGTAIPNIERGGPSIMVFPDYDHFLLFDLGLGTMRSLLKVGISPGDIKEIYLTHLHPDHTSELVPLLFAFRNPEFRRDSDLTIVGPPGFINFYKGLKNIYGKWIDEYYYRLNLAETLNKTWVRDECRIKSHEVIHTKYSLAYRIENNRNSAVVYSGDTDYCEEIIGISKRAELLILECAHPEGMKIEGHLTPALAGKIAEEAKVKKLILTHFYPVCKNYDLMTPCKKYFSGEVILARDLLKIKV